MSSLILTNRLYRFIKSSAIVNPVQAAVELLTNSTDAYNISGLEPPYRIDVKVNYNTKELTVWDQAIGLTGEKMVECFGQVGNYTSQETNRGYFSRGAKDITAIGNATFVAIKDGKISEVTLSTSDVFTVVRSDEPVTQEDRDKYQISENGLWNNLVVKESIEFPVVETFGLLKKYFSLRDIFSNKDHDIHITIVNLLGAQIFTSRVIYEYPEFKETLIDEEYTVDGYDNVTATFKLYLLSEPTTFSESMSYMEHGIMVSSVNAIHEIGTIYNDIRNHPYITHIYGRIDCSYINTLLYDFENLPDDTLNPFPIIDHSRLTGLNRSHPFTKALFRTPHRQLKYILQDMYENEALDTNFSESLSTLFKDIELFGKEFFYSLLDSVYPYKQIDKSQLQGYLVKKSSSIVNNNPDAKFNFSEPDSFIPDPTNSGTVTSIEPNFKIIFTDKEYMEFAYYIYRIDNQIVLEININDFMVSKYIYRNDEGQIIFRHQDAAKVLLLDIITEAMAREIMREKHQLSLSTHLSHIEPDLVFGELETIKASLTPKLYDILVKNDISIS